MKIILITCCIAMAIILHLGSQTHFVKNSLIDIDACEGKVKLTLVRTWGGDQTDDENQFFRFPRDIKIGEDNSVYISDSGNHRIQVFDRSGKYIKTVGTRGSGPADFFLQDAITIDKNNNIAVADNGNYRIQILDPNGKYLNSFRTTNEHISCLEINRQGKIVLCKSKYLFNKNSMINTAETILCDLNGKTLKNLYNTRESVKGPDNASLFITFSSDPYDNIYLISTGTPCFYKFSPDFKPVLIASFKTSPNTPEAEMNRSKNEPELMGARDKNSFAFGISTDSMGRIYIITTQRQKSEDEKFFLVSGPGVAMKRVSKQTLPEKTDRFRLLVFDKHGKITAAKKLSVFCDKIYVHEDTLFIVDSYYGMKIYEYRLNFD